LRNLAFLAKVVPVPVPMSELVQLQRDVFSCCEDDDGEDDLVDDDDDEDPSEEHDKLGSEVLLVELILAPVAVGALEYKLE